jgi:hypothetical protein
VQETAREREEGRVQQFGAAVATAVHGSVAGSVLVAPLPDEIVVKKHHPDLE